MRGKTVYIVRIVVLFVVLALLLAAAYIIINNGYGGFKLSVLGEQKYIFGAKFDAADIKTVEVYSKNLAVEISECEGEDIIVSYYANENSTEEKPTFTVEGDRLVAKQNGKDGISWNWNWDGRIVISVPKTIVFDYDINSVSGSIRVGARSDSLSASSVSGSIRINGTGNSVSALSTSGSIKIYEPFKNIDASSVSGSIKLNADYNTDSIIAISTSGSIKIALSPGDLGYKMDYNTTSGSVKDTYSGIDANGRSGVVEKGDKGLHIDASSVSGSIKLSDWS